MSTARHEVADDGLAIFDLRFNATFRKRIAGYDKREVELYIRQQDALMAKTRLDKEQLERQVIRLRQQLADAKEQLAELKDELAHARRSEPANAQRQAPIEQLNTANGRADYERDDSTQAITEHATAEPADDHRADANQTSAEPADNEPANTQQTDNSEASQRANQEHS